MKKALVFMALLILALQVNAYMLTLRKPGDTARMVTDGRIDVDSIQQMINDSLQLNRAGCYPLFSGKCRTYIDFPIAYATLRVYAGIEKVLVWETIDYKGMRWLNFRAYGYANPYSSTGNIYNYRSTPQNRFNYISINQGQRRSTLRSVLTKRNTFGYYSTLRKITRNRLTNVGSRTYYNTYSYRRYLIR